MKVNRKTFLKQMGAASAALLVPNIISCNNPTMPNNFDIENSIKDKEYWANIRQLYPISETVINLNNGATSPQALPVMQAFFEKHSFSNEAPSYNMWEKLNEQREPLRQQLADMLGCTTNEIAICRNTTEGLNNIIFGLNLKAGDEVVHTNLDYPYAVNTWKQRALRDGVMLKQVKLDAPEESEEIIIGKFDKAITHKTKVLHLTYVINWNGQVLPVKKITDLAHSKGCKVVIDGAHAFGQIEHNIKDIGADFYATSLHKWIGAPFGTGMFYIKHKYIESVWPLHATYDSKSDDIRKFETIGTRSFAAEMAVADAINFHSKIGRENIFNRLVVLKEYWVDKLKEFPNINVYSPDNINLSCGFATFGIDGYNPNDIVSYLIEKNNIHVSAVNIDNIKGVRVSPHIYNLTEELDIMVESISKLTGN